MYQTGYFCYGRTCFVHFFPYNHQHSVGLIWLLLSLGMMSCLSMNSPLNMVKTGSPGSHMHPSIVIFSVFEYCKVFLFSQANNQKMDHSGWFRIISMLVFTHHASVSLHYFTSHLNIIGLARHLCRNPLLAERPVFLSDPLPSHCIKCLRFLVSKTSWKRQDSMLALDLRKPTYISKL